MKVEVLQDDWGSASLDDISRLLDDVAGQLIRRFTQPPTGRIQVRRRPGNEPSPFTPYRKSPNDPFIIELVTRDLFWCQYAYQFAHEFCHVLSNYEQLRLIPNQWFHESLCELASIFTLKQMANTWQLHPPYPHWRDFASAFDPYVDETVNSFVSLSAGVTLGSWLKSNEPNLRANPILRASNGLVAIKLLPLFQSDPTRWQSICSIPNTDKSFAEFLAQWRNSCPDAHKPFISEIAQLFDITIY
jgi:hypothetical protein